MHRIVAGILFSLTLMGPDCAFAQGTDSRELVTQFVSSISQMDTTRSDAALLRAMDKYIAVDQFAVKALGPKFSTLPDNLRDRYLRSYRLMLSRFMKSRTARLHQSSLQILGVKNGTNQTEIVYTRLRLPDDREHDVIWYIRRSGGHRIVDIAYDGVLVTDRQRQEFDNIIERSAAGLAALPDEIDGLNP